MLTIGVGLLLSLPITKFCDGIVSKLIHVGNLAAANKLIEYAIVTSPNVEIFISRRLAQFTGGRI
jgi:hypothetical protein